MFYSLCENFFSSLFPTDVYNDTQTYLDADVNQYTDTTTEYTDPHSQDISNKSVESFKDASTQTDISIQNANAQKDPVEIDLRDFYKKKEFFNVKDIFKDEFIKEDPLKSDFYEVCMNDENGIQGLKKHSKNFNESFFKNNSFTHETPKPPDRKSVV